MADRGTKRKCSSCGINYYDLNRSPITCPKCDAVYTPMIMARSGRKVAAPPPVTAVVEPEEIQDDIELESVGNEFEETEDLPDDDDESFIAAGKDEKEHE